MNDKSCYTCKHRSITRESESWELDHIYWYVHECAVRPSIANLKQFPFNKTNCSKHETKNDKNKSN